MQAATQKTGISRSKHAAERINRGRWDSARKCCSGLLNTQMQTMQKTMRDQLQMVEERIKTGALEQERRLEHMRNAMEKSVRAMQEGNEKKLEEMRATVDEKLQSTLEKTLQQSFSRVSEQLESVYRGLGEMQTLATGVGDWKKVLSNVKNRRGILGEIQLGAILQQILTPEQYAENIATVKGSTERVEYAVYLPGDGQGEGVWLPIDAKFPADAYAGLLGRLRSGRFRRRPKCGKGARTANLLFCKRHSDKVYSLRRKPLISALCFCRWEGLYAEVVRRGMVERLQSEYHVVVAGAYDNGSSIKQLANGVPNISAAKAVPAKYGRF